MTKTAKTIVFFIVGAVFLLTAPSVVLYMQGYRLNFTEKKIVQTGGISLKAWPRSVQVYVNEKPKKKTGFLGQTFIGNLSPGTYAIRVSKEGYQDWQKDLEVKEKQVTAGQNIILFPKDFGFQQFTAQIKNAWLAPDGRKMAVGKNEAGKRIIGVLDLASKISQDFDVANLIGQNDTPQDLRWSNDGKKFLVKGFLGTTPSWGIVNLDNQNNPGIKLTFLGKNVVDVNFHPSAAEKLLVSIRSGKNYNIFEADINTRTVAKSALLQNVTAFIAFGDSLFWLDPNGYLLQGDLSGTPRNTLNQHPFNINPDASYAIFGLSSQKIFLKENETLFYLNPVSRDFDKISDSATELRFSPDGRKAAYASNSELWVIYLEAQEDQPIKKIGERAFLTRLSEKIYQLTWLRSTYLAFLSGEELKIAETDDRDGINILNITMPPRKTSGNQNLSKLFFSTEDRKLYILSDESLYSPDKPLTN